jgi:hypothetical protein
MIDFLWLPKFSGTAARGGQRGDQEPRTVAQIRQLLLVGWRHAVRVDRHRGDGASDDGQLMGEGFGLAVRFEVLQPANAILI